MTFRCWRCGADHGELPLSYIIGVPDACFGIPEGERDERVILGDESCSIDDRFFFLRGTIDLPITDIPDFGDIVDIEQHSSRAAGMRERELTWTVWAAVERRDFKRALAKWMRSDRTREPAYPMTLATDLPCYPPTLGLPGELETRPVGIRPRIRLTDADHLLVRAQSHGIPLADVRRIAEMVIHG